MNQYHKDRAEAFRMETRAENEKLYQEFLTKHPELKDSIATKKVFEDYFDFDEDLLAAESFEFGLGNLGDKLKYVRQHVPTEAETKATLIEKICELIASKNDGRDGKFSTKSYDGRPSELERERIKMSYWSLEQLTARLNEVVAKQQLNDQPLHEVKQMVRAHYAAQNQRPALPAEYTAERIKDHSFPVSELKKLIRMYGADVVNDRLFGRS